MPLTRTLGSLIATLLIGALTFFFTAPKNVVKAKVKTAKSRTANANEIDDLFI